MYLFSIANSLTVFQIWAKSVKFEPSYDLMRFIKSANFRRVWVGLGGSQFKGFYLTEFLKIVGEI